jgi:hypothetical protein
MVPSWFLKSGTRQSPVAGAVARPRTPNRLDPRHSPAIQMGRPPPSHLVSGWKYHWAEGGNEGWLPEVWPPTLPSRHRRFAEDDEASPATRRKMRRPRSRPAFTSVLRRRCKTRRTSGQHSLPTSARSKTGRAESPRRPDQRQEAQVGLWSSSPFTLGQPFLRVVST